MKTCPECNGRGAVVCYDCDGEGLPNGDGVMTYWTHDEDAGPQPGCPACQGMLVVCARCGGDGGIEKDDEDDELLGGYAGDPPEDEVVCPGCKNLGGSWFSDGVGRCPVCGDVT